MALCLAWLRLSKSRCFQDLDEICGTPLQPPKWPASTAAPFTLLDPQKFASRLGEDYEWAKAEIPFVDVEFMDPSDADLLLTTYATFISNACSPNTFPL
eukprot:COSAG01_NODE_3814_length_5671_cov_3.182161_2_plen_99_part_00